MIEPSNTLEEMVEEAIPNDCKVLLASLTILAKDLAEFLAFNAFFDEPAQQFLQIYAGTLDEERFYFSRYGAKLFDPLSETDMPLGFADAGQTSSFSLQPLFEKNETGEFVIDEEWTRLPGWALLKAFRIAYKNILCGERGPIPEFNRTGSGQTQELATNIALELREKKYPGAFHWFPFLAVLSSLIAKADAVEFCSVATVEAAMAS